LIGPAMSQRPSLQLTFQAGHLDLGQPRPPWRASRQDPSLAPLTPSPAPPFHGPITHP
jgi:hypothetical protein